jgi:hypothetical protein
MIHARQPTVEERRELQRMTRQAAGQVGQRARLILRSSQGDTAPELAPCSRWAAPGGPTRGGGYRHQVPRPPQAYRLSGHAPDGREAEVGSAP